MEECYLGSEGVGDLDPYPSNRYLILRTYIVARGRRGLAWRCKVRDSKELIQVKC